MDGDNGAEGRPGFRDFDQAGDIRDEIALAAEQAKVGDAGKDGGRDRSATVELGSDGSDGGLGEFTRALLDFLLMRAEGEVHTPSIDRLLGRRGRPLYFIAGARKDWTGLVSDPIFSIVQTLVSPVFR